MTNRRAGNLPLLAALAAAVFARAAAAQTPLGPAQDRGSAAQRANERAVTDRYLTTVQTELITKVDTRSAKPGQEVAARVRENAQLADGSRLPKGARLIGRVTQVEARTEQQPGAILAIAFDRAELKGGQTIALRSVIETIAPPASGIANTGTMGMDNAGPMSPVAGPGINTEARAPGYGGGGVLGGVARGLGSPASTGAGPIGATGDASPGSIDSAGRPIPGMPGAPNPAAVGNLGNLDAAAAVQAAPSVDRPVVAAGENVSGIARPTALPGVMLSGAPAGDASGLLTAAGRNITLESGTRITLGVITR